MTGANSTRAFTKIATAIENHPVADEDSKIHFGRCLSILKEHIRHHEEGLMGNRDKEFAANIPYPITP